VRAQHGLPPLQSASDLEENESANISAANLATESDPSAAIAQNPDPSNAIATIVAPGCFGLQGNPHPLGRYAYYPPPPPPTTPTVGHLALFNQHLQKKRVEWVYADGVTFESSAPASLSTSLIIAGGVRAKLNVKTTTPVWMVRVLVDGEYFGKGKGGTKKAARNEAAKEGLLKLGVIV
jgi:ribonuclease III